MAKNIISIHLEGDSWLASFIGPHAETTRELFGTATIPTPYTSAVSAEVVRTELAKRNPWSTVTIRE